MSEVLKMRFLVRSRTAAEWTALNEVLLTSTEGTGARELGMEEDTGKFKLGDGVTPWNDLPYSTAVGLPAGGLIGQVLTKQSSSDGDADWETPAASGIFLKTRVATYAALPSSGNVDGDAILVDADQLVYVWGGSAWPAQGAGLSLGGLQWFTAFNNTSRITNNFTSTVTVRNTTTVGALLAGRIGSPYNFPQLTRDLGIEFGSYTASWMLLAGYFGKAKNNSQGYPIDFDGVPQAIKSGGATSFSIAAAGTTKADPLSIFGMDPTDKIVISFTFAAAVALSSSDALASYVCYYKYASDASNMSTSGYSLSSRPTSGIQSLNVR